MGYPDIHWHLQMVFWWLLCRVTWAMFQPYEDCQIPWTGQSTSIDGTVDAGETTSQRLKHGIASTINNPKKLGPYLKEQTNHANRQNMIDWYRLQLVVLVTCGTGTCYLHLPLVFERLTSSSLSPCTTWSHGNLQDVFLGNLARPTKMQTSTLHCHHRHHHRSHNGHLQSWSLTPTSKSRWPSHILYDVLYVSQCTQCWPRFIPSP